MAGTDKLIGVLRLDLSQLSAEVEKANKLLKSLGQGVTLDLSAEVMKAVEQKIKTLTDAAEKYGKKMAEVGSQTKQGATVAQSAIQQVTKEVTTLNATTGQIKQVREGFDSLGQKITEVATSAGIISQKISQSFSVQTQAQQIRELVSLYREYAQARSKAFTAEYAGKDNEAQIWGQQAAAIREKIMAIEQSNAALAQQPQVIQAVASAEEQLALAQARVEDSSAKEADKLAQQNTYAKQAADLYKRLSTAVRDYKSAMKAGNESGMAEASARLRSLEQEIAAMSSVASGLDRQSKEYKEITAAIERMKTKYQEYQNMVAGQAASATATAADPLASLNTTISRITSLIGNMILYRGLRKFWTEAKSFAMDYYNTIKEIQVVTQNTDTQMSAISDDFKRMASDLNVSMTDIAKGAVIFYRQGLSTEETESRLSWATKFSKISGSSLEETSQYLTAVLNSMQSLNGDAQRVVDVFTYMGDNAATSGAEIATAMQKAAATADNAGMEFEFLAAAIATVSATTRQAPEAVGTAFNTMMARLHSIKQKGYNEEDETKINDVAKALDKVGIALMNSDGEWRDFDDILTDISAKWDTMTDKQRSYIATTMAGVRAQNYFIALMNDMSKGMEGGSQMWELYQGAKGSEGIVNDKYEVWLTGVEAAQNRLTLAVQKFYDALNTGDFFTGFLSGLADFINFLNIGIEATNGMIVIIPVFLGLLGAIVTAVAYNLAQFATLAEAIAVAFNANPVGAFIIALTLAVTAIAALTSGVVMLWNSMTQTQDNYAKLTETSKEKLDELKKSIEEANQAQQRFTNRAQDLSKLRDRYIELATKASLTKEEQEELKNVMQDISDLCPNMRSQIDQTTNSFRDQTGAVEALNDEIRENYRLAQLAGQHKAREELFGQISETSKSIVERREMLNNAGWYETEYQKWLTNHPESVQRAYAERQDPERYLWDVFFANVAPERESRSDMSRAYGLSGTVTPDALYAAHQDYAYNVAQLDADTKDLISQTRAVLGYYENEMDLSPAILQGARERAQEEVYSELDRLAQGRITETDVVGLARQLETIYQEAQVQQEKINNSAELNGMSASVEAAYAKYQRLAGGEGTVEEIKNAAKEYNTAAKEFNDAYKLAFGESKDVYSLIEEGAENLANAKKIVTEEEQDVDALIADRRRLREARESSFISQRTDLLDAMYDANGNIDKIGFRKKAQQIQENDPLIWEAMMKNTGFSTLYSNMTSNAVIGNNVLNNQANILKDTSDAWGEATEAAGEYYDKLKEAASGLKTDEDVAKFFADQYKTGGKGAVLDAYAAMLDNDADFTNAFMAKYPQLATIIGQDESGEFVPPEDFDADKWFSDLNALISGTSENFGSLIDVLGNTTSTAEETIAAIDSLLNILSGGADGQSLEEITGEWSKLTKEQQKALKSLGIDEAKFKGLKVGSKELKELRGNLLGLKTKNLESLNKVLSGTSKAVESLSKGTKEWTVFQKTLMSAIDTSTKLQGAYEIVLDKSKAGTDEYSEAMEYLSQQTGLSAKLLGTDGGMAMALAYIQNQTEIVQNSVAALANTLLSMSGINFDASQIVGGYIQLGAGADEAAVQVADLVNTALQLLGATISFNPNGEGGGSFSVNGIKSQTQFKNDTGGRGGGGGGGGSKNSFSDRLSKVTEQMGRSVDKYKEMLERLSLYESMYSDQGEYTNMLRVQEQRQKVLVDQQEAYEKILADMPELIKRAKDELSKYEEGTEEYAKAMSDLQGLEDSYASYTQELIKNSAEQLKNADAIKETREAIVVLESDLRNTIQSVIMDRNNREKASISARISMEGDVLDAIKNHYEKERDEIIETTDLRIKSLDKETEALSDALDERKQLAEDVDKQKELETLQDQYARIIADPTRAKEAKEIAKKISDLQEEMGWTAAEREVEAQQKIIDQQIESLEDYQEATNKYYDELLKDPRNFIDQYNSILAGTDAEIIDWLKENSDNYLRATDASRQELLQGWQDTLDELRMYTRTVWDEVEAIINSGDAGILEFLIGNSQEFREANAYGQADLIYNWTDMLEKWHAAYVDTFEDLDYMEFTNTVYDWITYLVEQAKSGGGGGGNNKAAAVMDEIQKKIAEAAADMLKDLTAGNSIGQATADGVVNSTGAGGVVGDRRQELLEELFRNNMPSRYASGGLAYGTGLAVLDGTSGLPERVLSPEQTQAFERLVDYITTPGRISVPGLSGGMIPSWSGGGAGAVFGDININVESLDSDADIDNLADKLMDAIDERMTRGMVVGGVAMGY